MIRFNKHDALQPEKETSVALDLTPLLVFVVGFLLARALLGGVANKAEELGHELKEASKG
ncbi:hypothetical protein [Deinococcus sp.]|uniref:hypothetical protein n=1 Tax=Deinococcus sp. TaxID=47478 RepID=UPI003B58BE2B